MVAFLVELLPSSRDRQVFMHRLFGDDSVEQLLADTGMLQYRDQVADVAGYSVSTLAQVSAPELTAVGLPEAVATRLLSAARERRSEHKEIGFCFATMVFRDMEVGWALCISARCV